MRSFESAMLVGERCEPFSAGTLIALGVTTVLTAGTAVYQMEQQKAMQKKALENQPKLAPAPPEAKATAAPKPLPQPAGPATGTTAASLAAQQRAAEEAEAARRRLGREKLILNNPAGVPSFLGTMFGA